MTERYHLPSRFAELEFLVERWALPATRGDAPDPNHEMSPSQLAGFKPLPP